MALIGTHIRFALDIKDDFDVKNLDKYITGTVYPDSRYVTKIDRKITHCLDTSDKKIFLKDDFGKGWMAHLIYDKIQAEVFKQIFPELFIKFGDEKLIISPENWVLRTSLKILQDIDDISKFPIKKYLKSLDYIETPNGEEAKLMKYYNKIFVDIYKKNKVETQDLINMWIEFEIEDGLIKQIQEKTEELIFDKNIFKKIPSIHPTVLDQYRKLRLF